MTWTGVGPLGPQKVYRIVEIPFAIKRWFDFQRYQYFSMFFAILMSLASLYLYFNMWEAEAVLQIMSKLEQTSISGSFVFLADDVGFPLTRMCASFSVFESSDPLPPNSLPDNEN